jgi:hypothetical protein
VHDLAMNNPVTIRRTTFSFQPTAPELNETPDPQPS